MISAQIDELRNAARGQKVMGLFELAQMLNNAADTIWQLRDDLQRANRENTELREQLAKARDPQRIGGTADPESFVYAIEQLREFRWQHATNDEEAIPYINNVADAHERENANLQETLQRRTEQFDGMCEMWVERGVENAKLRELAAGIGHLLFTLDVDYCATCPRDGINHPCPVYTVEGGECLYKTDLRDLGVEVDDGSR